MFLVESYVSRTVPAVAERAAERARRAAEELTSEGTSVILRHSIFVPEDEMLLLLYEADSAEEAGLASGRANLAYERITPAITGRSGPRPGRTDLK
jgi:hypothetical protein